MMINFFASFEGEEEKILEFLPNEMRKLLLMMLPPLLLQIEFGSARISFFREIIALFQMFHSHSVEILGNSLSPKVRKNSVKSTYSVLNLLFSSLTLSVELS